MGMFALPSCFLVQSIGVRVFCYLECDIVSIAGADDMPLQVCPVRFHFGIGQSAQNSIMGVPIVVTSAAGYDRISRICIPEPAIACATGGAMMANFQNITGYIVSGIQDLRFFAQLCIASEQKTGITIYDFYDEGSVIWFFRVKGDGAKKLANSTAKGKGITWLWNGEFCAPVLSCGYKIRKCFAVIGCNRAIDGIHRGVL